MQLVPLLLALSWPAIFAHPQVKTDRVSFDHWTIDHRLDRFTGAIACTTKRGKLELQGSLLLIRFGRRVDTTDSSYKVDGGAARYVKDSEAGRTYWTRHQTAMTADNPSYGVVAVPVADLATARTLVVRVDAAHRPETFDISDLSAIQGIQRALSCPATADD